MFSLQFIWFPEHEEAVLFKDIIEHKVQPKALFCFTCSYEFTYMDGVRILRSGRRSTSIRLNLLPPNFLGPIRIEIDLPLKLVIQHQITHHKCMLMIIC